MNTSTKRVHSERKIELDSMLGEYVYVVTPKTKEEPAFPRGHRSDGHNEMSLRDYFAAKAMQGLMDAAMPMPEIALAAYQMADKMMSARSQ